MDEMQEKRGAEGEEKNGAEEKRGVEKDGVTNAAFVSSADDDGVFCVEQGRRPSKNNQKEEELNLDYRYGCGSFKAKWLQPVSNIKVFVFLAVLLCLVEGFAVNGIANAALLHLEKQFGLKSSQSALISSSQDIGALLVVLFIGYGGSRFCKPHWVAVGSILMALGSFIFLIPHMAITASHAGGGPPPSGVCTLPGSGDNSSSKGDNPGTPPSSSSSDLVHYLGVFMVANMIHGIGFCPMFTLGTVYIDENAEHSVAAVYVGMTYAAAALGVALGFLVGGQISQNYYVDFDTIDQSKLPFGPQDPQWVGAWWVGFIPSCIAFLLLALPIYGFPKALPSGEKKVATTTADKKTEGKDAKTSLCKDILLPFILAVKQLVVNVPFLLLCFAAAAETVIISGMTSFAFKLLYEEYSISFDDAGNILGGLIIVGGVGMLSGGLIIRLLRLTAPGMCTMNGILDLVAVAFGIAILAGCSEVRLAGQEVPYPGDTSVMNYTSSCQGGCGCQGVAFSPVCGKDRTVYFSPCHAGCLAMQNPGPMATFHNCSCVAHALNVSSTAEEAMAASGRCQEQCANSDIFLPCMFLMFMAVLLTTTPSSMATLRMVDQDLRPFALSFNWMLIRLLGTIPGPPLVGSILDEVCLVWSSGPDGAEFCALYSKKGISRDIFIWWAVVNLVAATFHFLAAFFLRCRRRKSVNLGTVRT